MKRKLEHIEMLGNKEKKMSESVVFSDAVLGNNINFAFKLTDSTAKKNLVAGARRIAFEKDQKQKATKLKFSAGDYLVVAMPTLLEWKNICGESFNFNGLNIYVSEVKAEYEENSKHFDTKIVFLFGKNRVVLHFYNSTQNMKVEGKGYLEFIEKYLEPHFLQMNN